MFAVGDLVYLEGIEPVRITDSEIDMEILESVGCEVCAALRDTGVADFCSDHQNSTVTIERYEIEDRGGRQWVNREDLTLAQITN